jgi:hypothetical protein
MLTLVPVHVITVNAVLLGTAIHGLEQAARQNPTGTPAEAQTPHAASPHLATAV